ncbi:sulfate/molybdate ABC transporter ATP-binding protein [Oleispirillum naphthae]|uniref:sulfate/molybdate ABC transporter ATP-binding protein n=1 Tax=Oleispirillum naphthae TaxID=2838853 RepID=UPI0030826729
MRIDICNLSKAFDSAGRALNGIDMSIADGELVALLGPSGSGKTTLLRAIAGLETPDSGEILFDGENVASRDVRDRNVGFVFQSYALFKTMTVQENVGFGLSVRPRATRPPKAEIAARARELLRLVQLDGLEDRTPAQLSGGQRQRVALARALAIDPGVLLLDEPFGALDAKVRKELRGWLRDLHDRTGHTTVFVTHDQEEALELADRVAVINRGRLEQIATPAELYGAPATPFICEFLGSVNAFDVTAEGGRALWRGHALPLPAPCPAGAARLFVRAHELAALRPGSAQPGIPGSVEGVRLSGSHVRLDIRAAWGGPLLEAEVPILDFDSHPWKRGDAAVAAILAFRAF